MPSRAGSLNHTTLEIRKKLWKHRDDLVKGLMELRKSDNEQIQLKATELALAYAFGRPSQAVEGNIEGNLVIKWQK